MQQSISLKPYNTFGVDVKAKFIKEVATIQELKEVLQFSKHENIPCLFLGGGSNLLFTKDFEGLVIKLNFKGISEEIIDENSVLVKAQGGENWHEFVLYCIGKDFGGLENLSLIPGNVGTSPMQNIGAYGTEIKDVFSSCEALNINTFEIETFSLEDCQFGYRESFFKKEGKGNYVLLNVTFKLSRRNHTIKVEYGAIQSQLQEMGINNPTIKDVSNAVISIRESKLPNPKLIGNAGSFFKNPTIPTELYNLVKEQYSDIPGYPTGSQIKVPAGWLIEKAGWKGKQIGNVASHKLQALVLVNATGEASGQEILDFSSQIIESVLAKFGILLEREVNII